ncbi:hypothetical protein SAZ11_58850 [Streptomyces sp. FXJ1.4098]|nr:hypothetical protein [Streptomyces sp. FXJ1.4098]
MAETPMVNGKLPPQQEEFNDFMGRWVEPVRESVYGVEGGGYMYGGMQPGFWNDGAHGVVTVGRGEEGDRTQYVHVVTRPRTDLVRLRDNGYAVRRVTDLRTGEAMRFSQSGGHLSILGISDWDPYDTVFKVETDGRQPYYRSPASTPPPRPHAPGTWRPTSPTETTRPTGTATASCPSPSRSISAPANAPRLWR